MGRASRHKRERPAWWRREDVREVVRRVEGLERTVEERFGANVWAVLDAMRADRGHGLPEWPEWCWLPMAGAAVLATGGRPISGETDRMTGDETRWMALLAALAAWRVGRGIYRVDPELLDALVASELPGDVPTDSLFELPEWGLYLDLGAAGAFVHLEWDVVLSQPELRLLAFVPGGPPFGVPVAVHLDQPSLADALAAFVDQAARRAGRPLPVPDATEMAGLVHRLVGPFMAVVLYLVSTGADVADPDRPGAGPRRQAAPSSVPRVWEVGYRVGTALRAARLPGRDAGGSHASPAPHLRRAHWHTYLVGEGARRDPGSARRELRWVHPVLVGGRPAVPVVRRVRRDERA